MVNYRNTTNGESSNTLADIASVKVAMVFFSNSLLLGSRHTSSISC